MKSRYISQPRALSCGSVSAIGSAKDTSSSCANLPITISCLTCYVSLISVYSNVLMRVHDALHSRDQTSPRPLGQHQTRPEAHGLLAQLTGSTLSSRHVLQLRLHLEVMTHMLDRIEGVWNKIMADKRHINANGHEQSSESAFEQSTTRDLLETMLLHEGYDCSGEDNRLGFSCLDKILNSIRRMLRTTTFQ